MSSPDELDELGCGRVKDESRREISHCKGRREEWEREIESEREDESERGV